VQCDPRYFTCVKQTGYILATANLKFVGGTTKCTAPLIPYSTFYVGYVARATALCPSGWRAIGGGAKCDFTYSQTLGGGTSYGGGSVLSMQLNSDWTGFTSTCCAYVRNVSTQTSQIVPDFSPSIAAGGAWAGCVPEN
jgi:hypothetical protein